MVIGKPAPFVSAFVDAVDAAIRTHQPHHAMSVTQRTWLAFCITAVLVTNSICWARFARASLGTYALAALSWMFRHSKIPGTNSGSQCAGYCGTTASPRAASASMTPTTRARNRPRRSPICINSATKKVVAISGDKASARLGDPKISMPVGVVLLSARPECSAWYKTDKVLQKQGVPAKQRPRKPAPNPQYPTKEQLALRLLASFKAQQPDVRIHAVMADALYGTATFVDGASALFDGVQVISQIRSNQNIRVGQRHQHVADYFATHPGRPSPFASEVVLRS